MVVTSGQEGCAQPGAPRAAGSAAGHARGRGERHKQIGVQLRGGELARRRRARRGGRAAPGRVGRATRARKSPAQEGRPPKWLSLKTRLAVLVLVSCFNRHHPSAWKTYSPRYCGYFSIAEIPGESSETPGNTRVIPAISSNRRLGKSSRPSASGCIA